MQLLQHHLELDRFVVLEERSEGLCLSFPGDGGLSGLEGCLAYLFRLKRDPCRFVGTIHGRAKKGVYLGSINYRKKGCVQAGDAQSRLEGVEC